MNGITWTVVAMMAAGPPAGVSDALVREALGRFPRQTVHFEICDLARIRPLPGYGVLRQRFLREDTLRLVTSLATLGVHEEDVDRLALGTGPGSGQQGLELYGVAQGRFDLATIMAAAQIAGIERVFVNGYPLYCFEGAGNSPCIAILNETLGVFGSRDMVDFMLWATDKTETLSSDPVVTARVARAPADATIWGVATGPAVAEWVRVVMPMPPEGQNSLAPLLANVTSIAYEVRTGQKVTLTADLTCANADAAARLRESLDTVRVLQQLAWQTMNQGVANPYQQMTFRTQGTQLLISLTIDYAVLGTASAPESPGH
jgi:hypothetical protein